MQNLRIFPNRFSTFFSYKILGLSQGSSHSEVRKKYYELAKNVHPDVSKDEKSAIKFIQITKAYKTIMNSNNSFQKQQNHKQRQQKQSQTKKSKKRQKPIFESNEDDFYYYDEYYKMNHKVKPKRGQDIYVNTLINLQESILGTTKVISYIKKINCTCLDKHLQVCFSCGGKGQIYDRTKFEKKKCKNCRGYGYKNQCRKCEGLTYKQKQMIEQINIKENTHNENIIRIQGKGHQGYKHTNGDLYITINVKESRKFHIDGNNVYSQYQLKYLTAIMGGKINIDTITGSVEIEIQPNTQSGKQVRIFNEGLLSNYSKRKGDHIVKFKIKVPTCLTRKQKQLFQKLAKQDNKIF